MTSYFSNLNFKVHFDFIEIKTHVLATLNRNCIESIFHTPKVTDYNNDLESHKYAMAHCEIEGGPRRAVSGSHKVERKVKFREERRLNINQV